jgi:hypothetical protein
VTGAVVVTGVGDEAPSASWLMTMRSTMSAAKAPMAKAATGPMRGCKPAG